MELLNIKELRKGADGGNPKAPNAANYNEAKANPYPVLPDPLLNKDGKKVTTAEMWKQRRAEIIEDFDREIYGFAPKEIPKVTWRVTATRNQNIGGIPVTVRYVVGHVDNSAHPQVNVDISANLTIPATATAPIPVMVELGYSDGGKGGVESMPKGSTSWEQQVLTKGWGFVHLIPSSVQVENTADLSKGIIALCNKGQPRKVDDWGTVRAWAWGASRLLDYLETDKSVDAKQVGIEGVNVFGKVALLAMAYDERFAIGFIGNSSIGGAKLYRRHYGEQLENIAEPGKHHQLAGNFLKYAGPLTANNLPVDSHELIALCAPRPVFISSGSARTSGDWDDARGTYMAAVAAGPVYQLLGKKGLSTPDLPPAETAVIDGEIAFRQHRNGGSIAVNWPTFLQFADRYLKKAEK
jgi:hypothetical protein